MDVADIISDLDDHGFVDTSPERKLSVINETYHDVCSREPWPFLEVVDTNPTINNGVVSLPDLRAVLFVRSSARTVIPMRLDDFLAKHGRETDRTGSPYAYYFVGDELRLFPAPTNGTQVTIAYTRREPDLAVDSVEADILLPSEFHRSILVNGALYKLYAMEDDVDLAAGFERYFEQAIGRMRETLWKKQYQAPDTVREDFDPWADWE